MRSWTLALVVALGACRTTTPPAPPPESAWEAPLTFEDGVFLVEALVDGQPTRLVLDTTSPGCALLGKPGEHTVTLSGQRLDTTSWTTLDDAALTARGIGGVMSPQTIQRDGAIVVDFPRKRLVSLRGKLNAWLRWLDERAPKSVVESLPRASQDGALAVMARPGDGREAVTRLDSRAPASEFVAALFDPALVAGKTTLEGVHVRLGDSEFGPLRVNVAPALEGREGSLGLDVLGSVVLMVPAAPNQPLWVMSPRE
ncbi:MAG: hypothetical protein ACOZQL_00560 [Myxococcota bacterium]